MAAGEGASCSAGSNFLGSVSDLWCSFVSELCIEEVETPTNQGAAYQYGGARCMKFRRSRSRLRPRVWKEYLSNVCFAKNRLSSVCVHR